MFQIKNNDEIGAYFAHLVETNYRQPMRQFGIACLELQNKPINESTVQNMANRLSKIKGGEKGIQLSDLPIFTHLLGVTCEELLSAGEYVVPQADYMTVRQFAASHDKKEWKRFVEREDKPFLNCDEFGKNAIEYALEAGNFDLLKYLMDQGYIWFVDSDSQNYHDNFGMGTDIQRRDISAIDHAYTLENMAKDSDRLRRQMICLALDHRDFDMLNTLKAREIPSFYDLSTPVGCDAKLDSFRDETMIQRIADAEDKVIDYFSQEFTVAERYRPERVNTYIFPYIGNVADLLIEHNHPCAEAVLTRCAEHNRKFLEQLEAAIAQSAEQVAAQYDDDRYRGIKPSEEELFQQGLNELYLFRKEQIVSFTSGKPVKGAITNLVAIHAACSSFRLEPLVNDINESYHRVMDLTEQHR